MIKLHYITNGDMTLELENMTFGKHEKDPVDNVKSFTCKNKEIILKANNMNHFTNWGVIELIPEKGKQPILNASVSADSWGWYATAQIMVEIDEEIIINDNFQSGLKGPIGNPEIKKAFVLLSERSKI